MRRVAALFALIGLTLLVSAGPAIAHTSLIGSDPADGTSLATAPTQVSLTFNEPVQAGFTTVTVIGPDGNQWQDGSPAENGAVVSVPVRALGPAGEYTIGYQVLSADSHPVRGAVRFTLTTPGTGAPGQPLPAAQSGATPADPAAQTGPEDTPLWPWLVGAGVLLAAGAGVARWVSRSG